MIECIHATASSAHRSNTHLSTATRHTRGGAERITYANEETGYTVARVSARGSGSDLLTIVGNLLGAQPGESLRLQGRWKSHPQYGRQFEVASYTTVLPATLQGIRRYLGSGLIKGIGPKMAERIVTHFARTPCASSRRSLSGSSRFLGLGPKRTAKISAAWEEQKAIKEVMVFLQGVGVSTSLAIRIYKTYRTRPSASSSMNPIASPATCGASGSRRRIRSRRAWASLQIALSASRQGCNTPSRRPSAR